MDLTTRGVSVAAAIPLPFQLPRPRRRKRRPPSPFYFPRDVPFAASRRLARRPLARVVEGRREGSRQAARKEDSCFLPFGITLEWSFTKINSLDRARAWLLEISRFTLLSPGWLRETAVICDDCDFWRFLSYVSLLCVMRKLNIANEYWQQKCVNITLGIFLSIIILFWITFLFSIFSIFYLFALSARQQHFVFIWIDCSRISRAVLQNAKRSLLFPVFFIITGYSCHLFL